MFRLCRSCAAFFLSFSCLSFEFASAFDFLSRSRMGSVMSGLSMHTGPRDDHQQLDDAHQQAKTSRSAFDHKREQREFVVTKLGQVAHLVSVAQRLLQPAGDPQPVDNGIAAMQLVLDKYTEARKTSVELDAAQHPEAAAKATTQLILAIGAVNKAADQQETAADVVENSAHKLAMAALQELRCAAPASGSRSRVLGLRREKFATLSEKAGVRFKVDIDVVRKQCDESDLLLEEEGRCREHVTGCS